MYVTTSASVFFTMLVTMYVCIISFIDWNILRNKCLDICKFVALYIYIYISVFRFKYKRSLTLLRYYYDSYKFDFDS